MGHNRRITLMDEKVYKTMAVTGAGNIALGVIMLVSGIACGIVAIVSGAKLLKRKSDIIF
jgi:threonine dehydrogenase-like Zn-dependent dehydrogenase